jgi:hypothetical protein
VQRVLLRMVIGVTGLTVALMAGSVAAQAAQTRSGTVPRPGLSQALADTFTCGSDPAAPLIDEGPGSIHDDYSFVPGTDYHPANNNLYFDSSGIKTTFCANPVTVDGLSAYEIVDSSSYDNGWCLDINNSKSPNTVGVDTPAACNRSGGQGYLWDDWLLTPIPGGPSGTTIYTMTNLSSGQCLYDNTQRPAITDACNSSDGFEQFDWLHF